VATDYRKLTFNQLFVLFTLMAYAEQGLKRVMPLISASRVCSEMK